MNYGEPVAANYSFLDSTITPFEYQKRVDLEICFNASAHALCFCLLVFVRFNDKIWDGLKSTIVFVTGGAFLLSLPYLSHQTWMALFLHFGRQPSYPIIVCSLVKLVTVALQTSAHVLPFSVAVYRYQTVVRMKAHSTQFVFFLHTAIVSIYVLLLATLSIPFGQMVYNRVCAIYIFNQPLEVARIIITIFFNISSILMNCLILRHVRTYEQDNPFVQARRIQVTWSLLVQSLVPVVVSLPLLLSSFHFQLGLPVPPIFSDTLYAFTFVDPVVMPLSAILSIKSTRNDLFRVVFWCFRKKRRGTSVETVTATVCN